MRARGCRRGSQSLFGRGKSWRRVASGERRFGEMESIIEVRVAERGGEAAPRHAGVCHSTVSAIDCGEFRVAGRAVRRAVVRPAERSAPVEGTELKACRDVSDDGVETGGAQTGLARRGEVRGSNSRRAG